MNTPRRTTIANDPWDEVRIDRTPRHGWNVGEAFAKPARLRIEHKPEPWASRLWRTLNTPISQLIFD